MKGVGIMIKKNDIPLENIMPTPNDKFNKDHELLIRIDERLNMICNELTSIKQMQFNQQTQSNENKKRLDNIELTLYGTKNVDGMYQKLEKHDKLLAKAVAYFTVIAVLIEFVFKFYFHGGM